MCQQRINQDDLITADDSGIVEEHYMFPEEDVQPSLCQLWLEFLRDLHPATWMLIFLLLCLFVSLLDQIICGMHIH